MVGIATATSGDSAARLHMPIQQAQTLAGERDKVTAIYVKATDSQQIDSVERTIQKNVPRMTVTTSARPRRAGLRITVHGLQPRYQLRKLAVHRGADRGVPGHWPAHLLRRVRRRVTRQVVGEAVVNGLAGGALDIALGLAGAYAVAAISPSLQAHGSAGGGFGGPSGGGPGGGGFGGPGRQSAKSLEVAVPAPVSVTTILLAVRLAVAGRLTAGTFGGWRASRLRPADALRRVE